MSRPGAFKSWLRLTPFYTLLLLLLSGTVLGLSIAQANQLKREEIRPEYQLIESTIPGTSPSLARIIFYTCTAPFIATLYTPLDYVIYLFSRISAILSLIFSCIITLAFAIQVGFWTHCEVVPPSRGGVHSFCPHHAMVRSQHALQTPTEQAKFALGWTATALWACYAIVATDAVRKGINQRKVIRRQELRRVEVIRNYGI